jgi:hypothetical protein
MRQITWRQLNPARDKGQERFNLLICAALWILAIYTLNIMWR